MIGYNVPTSSSESTKTESTNEYSESPVSGKPKIGNGHARIKLVRELVELAFTSIARTLDMTHLTTSQNDEWTAWFYAIYTKWNTWLNTDYILMGHSPGTSTNEMTYSNEEFSLTLNPSWGGLHRIFPFSERKTIYGVSFDVKLSTRQSGYSYILLEVDNITDEKTLGGHAEVLTAMKPTDMTFDFTIQFEDTDWHHVEYVFSAPVINANYMQIAMFGLYSGNIKNIKFLT